jgi:hypothetical protein
MFGGEKFSKIQKKISHIIAKEFLKNIDNEE